MCLIKRRKAKQLAHILHKKCLLKQITKGKIGGLEVTGRQGREHKQLPDHIMETREYWTLKQEALGHTMWRIHFGTDYLMNEASR